MCMLICAFNIEKDQIHSHYIQKFQKDYHGKTDDNRPTLFSFL